MGAQVGAAASGIGLSASFSQALAMMESRGGVSRRLGALLCVAAAAGAAAVPPAAGLFFLDGRLRLYAAVLSSARPSPPSRSSARSPPPPPEAPDARATLFSRFTFGSSPALCGAVVVAARCGARGAPLDHTQATDLASDAEPCRSRETWVELTRSSQRVFTPAGSRAS